RARDGFHPAYAGRHTTFGHDLEKTDVTGASNVGAAAQLARRTDIQHADHVSVLFAKQGNCPALHRFVVAHELCTGRVVLQNLFVDDALDLGDLLGRHGRVVSEVEARLFSVHQRATLLNVTPQHFAQGLVHQVGGGMVAHSVGTVHRVDLSLHDIAHSQLPFLQLAVMPENTRLDFLRVGHEES